MTAPRYSGFPCSFTYGASQTLSLQQLGSAEAAANLRKSETTPAGALDRAAVVLAYASPSVRIVTEDLATVLGAVSPTVGLNCNGLCTFRYQKRADSSTFAGSTNNVKAVAQTGFLAMDRISAAGESKASCDLMFVPLYDGSNDPLLFTDAIDLSGAPQPAYSSEFYLGPLYYNNAQISGLLSARVDFGIDFRPFKGDGDLFPRSGAIFARRPMLSFTLTKANFAPTNFASMFNNSLSATLAQYFLKGSPGAGRIAAGSSVHCKVSIATGGIDARSLVFREENDAEVTVEVQPTGTISVSIASTVP